MCCVHRVVWARNRLLAFPGVKPAWHELLGRYGQRQENDGEGLRAMVTFFTTAKPFTGHSKVIQRNALASWKLIHPNAEVMLFGDEDGAAETAAELGIRHVPN